MAVIKSGATTDQLTIDATSKAARVTTYDTAGLSMIGKNTYVATVTPTASAAGTGVLFNFKGSATKTVKVYRIRLTATVGTAVIITNFVLSKRTVNGSGGTPVALTALPADTNNAAATATGNVYSALATAGTGGGILDLQTALVPLVSSTTLATAAIDFVAPSTTDGSGVLQPWVLRGTSESLEIATLATMTNTPTFGVSVFFTEE